MPKRRKKPTNVNVPRDEFEERVGPVEDSSEFIVESLKEIAKVLDEHSSTQMNILKALEQQSKYLEDLSSKKRRE